MELLPEGGAVPQVRLGSFLEEPPDPSSSRDGERRRSLGLRGGGGPDSQRDPPTLGGVGQPWREIPGDAVRDKPGTRQREGGRGFPPPLGSTNSCLATQNSLVNTDMAGTNTTAPPAKRPLHSSEYFKGSGREGGQRQLPSGFHSQPLPHLVLSSLLGAGLP